MKYPCNHSNAPLSRSFGLIILLGSVLLGGAFLACGKKGRTGSDKDKLVVISWTGCGISKKAYMSQMAKEFKKKTGITVNISGGGATRGIRFASVNKSEMGGSCRHKIAHNAEKNARGTVVAWDALVVIVNPLNPVRNISSRKLKAVLTGKIKNWSKLGGKNAPIDVLVRDGKNSGVGRLARELIFKDRNLNYSPAATNYPSSGPLERAVEKNQNAIAISGISSVRKRKVKWLRIDGVGPSYGNIASGKYPFFRPLYLFTGQKPNKNTRDFIKFVKSEEGQAIIKKQETVNLADARQGGLFEKFDKKMKALGIDKWQE